MCRKLKPTHWTRAFLFALIASLTACHVLQASDFQSPRTMGLGGAGHAAPLLNDSIYLNPSYTSFSPYRGFSGNYLWQLSDQVNSAGQSTSQGTGYNFSTIDGTPDSLFQAGVGFTKRGDASLIHIGASKSILNRLGFGLGSKFIFPYGTNSRLFDGTLSISGIATDWLQASIIVDNLLQANMAYGFYREFSLATKFNIMSILSIYLDPLWVPALPSGRNFGHELGIEISILSDFSLRFGGFRNAMVPFEALRGDGYGFGLGWLGPKISVDYGLSRIFSPRPATAHQLGMTIFF